MAALSDASTTSLKDWSYIAEGGASIVFAYTGPPHSAFTGKVLRLRKVKRGSSAPPHGATDDTEDEADDPEVEFQTQVVAHLVPLNNLALLEPVRVNRTWLEKLAALEESYRPPERRNEDTIDVGRKKGVLAPNLVGSVGWTVELKPKWSFLPNPTYLSDETKATKVAHCRFCLRAHERSVKDKTLPPTAFCPLDLFSGETDRVLKGLNALWDSWIASDGTINNLRVFINGQHVFPSDKEAMDQLNTQFNLPNSRSQDVHATIRGPFTSAIASVLHESKILQVLDGLQRTLDPLDIEGLEALWKRNAESAELPFGTAVAEPTLPEWSAFLQRYLTDRPPREQCSPNPEDLRYYLLSYLLCATFKDCSIMVRFAPGSAATATVIDLDPKSTDRFTKWRKQDADVVRCFVEAGDKSKPPCRDTHLLSRDQATE